MFCLEPEEPPCSTLAFFFLAEAESAEGAGRFSTAGVDRARFLNSSRSRSRLASMALPRHQEKGKETIVESIRR